jgi:hypothetical protein
VLQRWCSDGGCRNWLRSEGCVGRDGAVMVAAGNGVWLDMEFFCIGEKDKYMIFFAYNKPI